MAEPRLISPMLDGFMMSTPISEHHGICCCPAINKETDDKYIVKVISIPATSAQTEALLLSGAFTDEESALSYYKELADTVLKEVDILNSLSTQEGFVPYEDCQLAPIESGKGYEIYLLGSYKRSLAKHFKGHVFTHLDALNLGLDLCAALSVCRRNGYMYVDLKPDNVFVIDQRIFRIGDLGFVSLDSLKYAFLSDKYLSVYTPPEVRDAFSDLNNTMDVYAAGLILYQTYNNGELPFNSDIHPGDELPAPLYADYEMSEIILQACNPNPDKRWQDPMQMGQAIVSYMQRNGAIDTPIIPMPTQDQEAQDEETGKAEAVEATEAVCSDEVRQDVTESTEAKAPSEEELNNLSLLADATDGEEVEEVEADYTSISEDVSEILNQADELAVLDVPEPVIIPEHVDVPMPEPIIPEGNIETKEIEGTEGNDKNEEQEDVDETKQAEISDPSEESDVSEEDGKDTPADSTENSEDNIEDDPLASPVKKRHWLRNTVIAFVVLALLAGGIYHYRNFYLLPIDYITVEGKNDTLTVFITTDADESLLQIVCSDAYGNQMLAPVIGGKAEFTALVPNMAYSVKVVSSGFHKLTGRTTATYSAPMQTNIVQFDAIAGNTEDSVILSFTAEGHNSDEWTVYYIAEGEEERSAVFTEDHMLTVTNLTVGKEYTFRLESKQELYVSGQNTIKFTPRTLIRANKLALTNFLNNTLTVTWSAPAGENVAGWTVQCYNESYNKTIVTMDTTATFETLDHATEYNIEVTAVGMSVSEKLVIPANTVMVYNFKADTSDPTKLILVWKTNLPVPDDGWVLRYSVVGLNGDVTVRCDQNSSIINLPFPHATYKIQLEDTKGTVLLGSINQVTTGNAADFNKEFEDFTVSRDDLNFYMCRTPDHPNWGRYDLEDSDYTTTFAVGVSASFLVRAEKSCYVSNEKITTMFVIYDQTGTPVLTAQETKVWSDMWTNYNCKMNIPVMPTISGNYTIEVFFNGGLAHSQAFTIQ